MKTMRFHSNQIQFLGVNTQIPIDSIVKEPIQLWEQFYNDQTMQRLQELCKSNKVYGIVGYNWNEEAKTVSYSIACENRSGAVSEEYTRIEIEPSGYIAFEQKGNGSLTREQVRESLYEEALKKWIPESEYEASIDVVTGKFTKGLGMIETIVPNEPSSVNYCMELWIPVNKK